MTPTESSVSTNGRRWVVQPHCQGLVCGCAAGVAGLVPMDSLGLKKKKKKGNFYVLSRLNSQSVPFTGLNL